MGGKEFWKSPVTIVKTYFPNILVVARVKCFACNMISYFQFHDANVALPCRWLSNATNTALTRKQRAQKKNIPNLSIIPIAPIPLVPTPLATRVTPWVLIFIFACCLFHTWTNFLSHFTVICFPNWEKSQNSPCEFSKQSYRASKLCFAPGFTHNRSSRSFFNWYGA